MEPLYDKVKRFEGRRKEENGDVERGKEEMEKAV